MPNTLRSSDLWGKRDKEKMRGYNRKSCAKTKKEVLTHYGNGILACVRCGFSDIKALSLDHINGGGFQDRVRYSRAGTALYRWLRKQGYPEGYQTLCMNCQWIKRVDNEEIKKCQTR